MKDKKKLFGIITLVIGVIVLAFGVVFLVLRLNAAPEVSDAEYLVKVGNWKIKSEECVPPQCEGEDSECPASDCKGDGVYWTFTEIGKGTLTTNNHQNDYDFIWAIEGDKLKIETSWLYTMNDEYTYKLDQGTNTLTLDDKTVFVAQD